MLPPASREGFVGYTYLYTYTTITITSEIRASIAVSGVSAILAATSTVILVADIEALLTTNKNNGY